MIKPVIKTTTKVVIGPCRLCYVHVFNKYNPDGAASEGKYMANILIPKNEKETIKAIEKAIAAAKETAIISKWGGKDPKKLDLPLRDGDEKEDPAFENCFYLNARSNTRPGVVDRQGHPITDEEEIYSGVYALTSITFYGYEVSGNRGIAVGLDNIMKFKDGERLGGRASAESDFGGIEFDDDDDDEL
jgi:hypothetical protein